MAREKYVWNYTRQAGYEPLEDRCIIVKYAPANRSEQFAAFYVRIKREEGYGAEGIIRAYREAKKNYFKDL